MISMYTKQEIIIRSYREGKSQRCISRKLSISRKTVKKYIMELVRRWMNQNCTIRCQLDGFVDYSIPVQVEQIGSFLYVHTEYKVDY